MQALLDNIKANKDNNKDTNKDLRVKIIKVLLLSSTLDINNNNKHNILKPQVNLNT